VTTRRVTIGLLLAILLAACSDGDDAGTATTDPSTTTTAPTTTAAERPASTTTTAFDPQSVEGEVEAAYLRSWDVYADAVYHLELDDQAFAEVYAGEHLETKTQELERRIADGRAALAIVDHEYTLTKADSNTYRVVDKYRNHQVLIDAATKDPIEPDPDEIVLDVVTIELIDGQWRVTFVEELE
jgi:hypothetical protein